MKKIDWDEIGYETQSAPSEALIEARRELVRAEAKYIDARLAEEIRIILANPLYDS